MKEKIDELVKAELGEGIKVYLITLESEKGRIDRLVVLHKEAKTVRLEAWNPVHEKGWDFDHLLNYEIPMAITIYRDEML